jgi:hypothetical protein
MAAQAESRDVGHPATPLIDTLPCKKQKQIYQIAGVFRAASGMCGNRLRAFKATRPTQAAVGIDTDDENDDSLI